jgi:hypothetical protein
MRFQNERCRGKKGPEKAKTMAQTPYKLARENTKTFLPDSRSKNRSVYALKKEWMGVYLDRNARWQE